jgi:hypothetical protein
MSGAGKGDDYRAVDYKKWCENYDRIFGDKADVALVDKPAPKDNPDKKDSLRG